MHVAGADGALFHYQHTNLATIGRSPDDDDSVATLVYAFVTSRVNRRCSPLIHAAEKTSCSVFSMLLPESSRIHESSTEGSVIFGEIRATLAGCRAVFAQLQTVVSRCPHHPFSSIPLLRARVQPTLDPNAGPMR